MYLVEQVSRVSSKELHKQVERAIDTIVKWIFFKNTL